MNRIKQLCAEADITISQLARRIDMQPHALRRYTRHESEPKLSLAKRIGQELNVGVEDVIGMASTTAISSRSIPLYGAAEGGVGVEITDVSAPIDQIEAPSFLASVTDGYAVYITGSSMEPRFRSGEIAFVHPHKPVRAGDDVIVQIESDGKRHAVIKQFKRFDDDAVVLAQHNPEKEITYQKSEVSALHSVIGTYVS